MTQDTASSQSRPSSTLHLDVEADSESSFSYRRQIVAGFGLAALASAAHGGNFGRTPIRIPRRVRPKAKLRGHKKDKALLRFGEAGAVPLAVLVHRRLTFGSRPGELTAFQASARDDSSRLTHFLATQLAPSQIDDSAANARLEAAALAHGGGTLDEVRLATLIRRLHSKRQLFEVMVDFWHQYFAVLDLAPHAADRFGDFDAVIRAHALGSYSNLVTALTGAAPAGDIQQNAADVVRRLTLRLLDGEDEDLIHAGIVAFTDHANSGQQIAQTLRTMVTSAAFRKHWGEGTKRPLDLALLALRATGAEGATRADAPATVELMTQLTALGQPLFSADGSFESTARLAWSSTLPRIRGWHFGRWLARSEAQLPIISMPAEVRHAEQAVDFWADQLLGHALPSKARSALVHFVEGQSGRLQQRMRPLIGLILMSPFFQWT